MSYNIPQDFYAALLPAQQLESVAPGRSSGVVHFIFEQPSGVSLRAHCTKSKDDFDW